MGDVAYMRPYKTWKFCVIFVDSLSFFLFLVPLSTLKSKSVANGFKTLIEKTGRIPSNLYTGTKISFLFKNFNVYYLDGGTEFAGPNMREVYSEFGINHIIANDRKNKAMLAENSIK